MKIAVDLDDVLAGTVFAVLDFYNSKYSPKVNYEDLSRYSYWGFLGETREEANRKFFDFVQSEYFNKILPVQGSILAIDKLLKEHELYIVTGRPKFAEAATLDWLSKHFPGKFEDVLFTNNRMDKKDLSAYWGRPKAEICEDLGAQVLIDDLHEYIDGSEGLQVYLLNQPWNQAIPPEHVTRVSGWEEIVSLLAQK